MAKTAKRSVQGAAQKDFAAIFDGMVGKYSRYQVWQDFVTLAAVSVSNAVDQSHAEEREKLFRSISRKYNEREMNEFSRMLAAFIVALDKNPDQDFLGEMYMALNLGNNHAGQFFTPYHVCKCMARLSSSGLKDKLAEQHWISVNDCACGAGATLIAFANECRARGVNYQQSVFFVAQDIDLVVGMMCYLQLSLLGCPGYVVIADTLSNPVLSVDGRGLIPVPGSNIWYTPMYFIGIWQTRRWFAQNSSLLRGEQEGQAKKKAAPKPEPSKKQTQPENAQLSLF